MTLLPVFLFPLACVLSYWLGVRLGQRREVIDLPPPGGDLQLYRTVKARLDEAGRERDQAQADARRARNVSEIVGTVNRELLGENERLKARLAEAVAEWGEWRDYSLGLERQRDRANAELAEAKREIEQGGTHWIWSAGAA